jgi:hypothetical protein
MRNSVVLEGPRNGVSIPGASRRASLPLLHQTCARYHQACKLCQNLPLWEVPAAAASVLPKRHVRITAGEGHRTGGTGDALPREARIHGQFSPLWEPFHFPQRGLLTKVAPLIPTKGIFDTRTARTARTAWAARTARTARTARAARPGRPGRRGLGGPGDSPAHATRAVRPRSPVSAARPRSRRLPVGRAHGRAGSRRRSC